MFLLRSLSTRVHKRLIPAHFNYKNKSASIYPRKLLTSCYLYTRGSAILTFQKTVLKRSFSTKMPPINNFVESLIKDNKIMVFSKSYCPYCNKVKDLFSKLGYEYKAYELDLEANGPEIEQILFQKTNQETVPNIFIREKHIGGCSDTEKAYQNGSLQKLWQGDAVKYDFDLFVIGGGSGGLACSKEAADLGAKVAVADFVVPSPAGSTWGLGGTCVNVGCIPKKLMHQAALLGEAIHDSRHYGWNIEENISHDWAKMVDAIQQHIRSLNWGYKVNLRQKNVKYYNMYATFLDNHTLQLTDKSGKAETVTADKFVLATGGRPTYPDIPGAKECAITSDDIFSLPYVPGKVLFCGASYIALECAGFTHGIGMDTTVMMRSIPLRGFDQFMANKVVDYMETIGIKFLKKYTPIKMEKVEEGTPGKIKVTYMNHNTNEEESDIFNTVVVAIGRSPCTKGLGLENLGVKLNPSNGFLISDEYDRTNIENIYGVGDILDGKPELTPVAIQAGKLLAKRLFNGSKVTCDYTNVATTVFTPLEYGACGLSEETAIEKYGEDNIEVYHSNFTPLEATVPHRLDNVCYAKVVCNKNDEERILGMHVLGPNAGEIIQGFSIAFKVGAKKQHLDDLIGIHPTNAEIFTTLEKTKRSGDDPSVTGC
ncbi:thioredoxin reductase 1, cytoplasmic isoform X4 [Hydra vulgaris]|uniref:thioredoxin-disulfide reductase (NADPH) n=1 Tax=Hydra vulgaris TaxID=6087 RepID=A0ABM4C5X3_HYDVU